MREPVSVAVSELKIFRKIIQREANIVLASYAVPGSKALSDTTPHFIVREYLEMQRALGKLDGFIAEKGGRK